jgi:endonuclease/exonuclease/phosphatase family metal-dependent hydrolase
MLRAGLLVLTSLASAAAASRELEIATWNIEWLVAPSAVRALRPTCVPPDSKFRSRERVLPCDVAYGKERGNGDFAALARYARKLDADVVALQEVDGPEAARLVFPGHAFCFTGRAAVQNTGFAIRPGIPYRCGTDARGLSLDDTLRRGAEVVLFPGTPNELRLLSVHLKSGCARDPLDSGRDACTDLARQTVALESWIDSQARLGRPFAILGDFNRDLLREPLGTAPPRQIRQVWSTLDDGDPPEADLTNALQGVPFIGCAAGAPYRSYIDFIVLSRTLGQALVPGSFERITYDPADVWRFRLSDHCPLAVRIRLNR